MRIRYCICKVFAVIPNQTDTKNTVNLKPNWIEFTINLMTKLIKVYSIKPNGFDYCGNDFDKNPKNHDRSFY